MGDQQHSPLLRGELVRFTAGNPDADTELIAGWFRDSEFARLLDSGVARPLTVQSIREELEEEPKPFGFPFVIRTLTEDKLIGFVGMWAENWTHGDAWLGIGIGERDYWGRGYGADALRIALHYAFTELNLHRVSLSVFAYNTRAIRAYEKVGFVVEGRLRQLLYRDGQRWDEVVMGVLKEEWERETHNANQDTRAGRNV